MTDWVLCIGLRSYVSLLGLYASNTVNGGARVLKNFGAPLATKFTYKMRLGGKGMWGPGPALYKNNYLKKNLSAKEIYDKFGKK